MGNSITAFVESVLAEVVRARSLQGNAAREISEGAVRAAATWFFDAEAGGELRGFEMERRTVGQIASELGRRHGLSPDKQAAAWMALDMISEALGVVVTGRQHVDGWIRPRPMSGAETDSLVRSCIQGAVNAAAYFVSGSVEVAARAQDLVAGIELDPQAIAAAFSKACPVIDTASPEAR